MYSHFDFSKAARSASVLLLILLVLMVLTTALFAAFVDTDDTLVDPSWQDTPFVTDPAADQPANEDPDTDVLAAWLQSDNDFFYFRMKFNDKPALSTDIMRTAAVAIDCEDDGDFDGPGDRTISYIVDQDVVWITEGNQWHVGPTKKEEDGGELAGSPDDDNVEWTAEIEEIEENRDSGSDPSFDCDIPEEVDIKFGSADSSEFQDPPPPPRAAHPLDQTEIYTWHMTAGKALPRPTTLAAEESGNEMLFTWEHTGQNESYQVYRNDSPYFAPDDAGVSAVGVPITTDPWQTSDAGVVGTPSSSHYYTVVGQVDLGEATSRESDPSNEIGLFEFNITPGNI